MRHSKDTWRNEYTFIYNVSSYNIFDRHDILKCLLSMYALVRGQWIIENNVIIVEIRWWPSLSIYLLPVRRRCYEGRWQTLTLMSYFNYHFFALSRNSNCHGKQKKPFHRMNIADFVIFLFCVCFHAYDSLDIPTLYGVSLREDVCNQWCKDGTWHLISRRFRWC